MLPIRLSRLVPLVTLNLLASSSVLTTNPMKRIRIFGIDFWARWKREFRENNRRGLELGIESDTRTWFYFSHQYYNPEEIA